MQPDIPGPLTAPSPGTGPVQRLRFTFSKDGAARYISHLDLARALERALNRAALPVAYTQGFNRRPRLSLASALPLGYTSRAELADVWLTATVNPATFRERLVSRMAPGIMVLEVAEVPLAAPSLQSTLIESLYEVRFQMPVESASLRVRITELLASGQFFRTRARPKGGRSQEFDLRPLILEMSVDSEAVLHMRLVQTATQTGRPDDVLAALGLDPLDAHVCRTGLRFVDGNTAPS